MTSRTLTAPQRRALLWLAERPGMARRTVVGGITAGSLVALARRGLAERAGDVWTYRATPAGIQAAKEIADAVA